MKFVLDIQLFASKKGVGSTKNGRDSHSKRLGAKLADGQFAHAGSIIYRQRGTKIHPGTNVGRGGDDTLFAKVNGIVKCERLGKDRKKVSVLSAGIIRNPLYGDFIFEEVNACLSTESRYMSRPAKAAMASWHSAGRNMSPMAARMAETAEMVAV